MSASGLRERSGEKPFQVEAKEEGGLSSHWSHSALIQFWIVFDSEVVLRFKSKLALISFFVFSRMQLLDCKRTKILQSF